MTLKEAAQDKLFLAELEKFFADHLDRLALEKVYSKQDTHGIADALEALKNAFEQLDAVYNPKENKKPINIAR